MKAIFGKMSFGKIYYLLLYLEENISIIQDYLSIVNYTNQEISELEANKNAIVYLSLENDPDELISIGGKMFYFTEEELPLFLKVFSQQLHEIFIKKSVSTDQYLE
ncbi:hypothetical protein C1645_825057 [Glomus cerebriforme]|uniref:Uncharacterized protein n=1 Tax=Glomus cerebriforme TaxID=658196 RepID=A0A397SU97_9GLOM|nr:hypothetical protein C1645_825057 [Glomus cerebriforme]